jgi:tRNA (guanine-N7-)-methyltransferase
VASVSEKLNPKDFIITRKRKKYRFALFRNSPICYEVEEWRKNSDINVLEMGAGTGLFSVELAKLSPSHRFVGVDVKADRLQTGARRAEDENVSNIQFLRARADLLEELFVPNTLNSIWITFPDPFPKERSAKHRLTHPKFLKMYKTLLKPNGQLYFKTDAHNLFDWSLEQLIAEGWNIKELSFDLHESSLSDSYKIMTTYETRFNAEGLPTYFVAATPPKK